MAIHHTAEISPEAYIGERTSIWNWAQIRAGARIGDDCVIGKGVYIDSGVVIGNRVKVQNHASLFHGLVVEDGVFVGPHVCFTNDLFPRAINPDGTLKTASDWVVSPTRVKFGASIGANATIVCGVTIGRWAMIGAGSVVTRDVQDHGLVVGNTARMRGWVCVCGVAMTDDRVCPRCGRDLGAERGGKLP